MNRQIIGLSVTLLCYSFLIPASIAVDKGKTDSSARRAAVAVPVPDSADSAKQKQAELDQTMINAVNEIDGVNVDAEIFKEKKGLQLGDLNPVKWIFKPVIDMQKQVIHLEKQIMRLEAPIASLQKPMVGLRQDMVSVQDEMKVMHTDINNIRSGMKGVDSRLGHIEGQLDKMYEPIVALQEPVVALKNPVVGVGSQLTTLKSDLKELKDVVSFTTRAILLAVIAVGILIVLGTPVAALFAWRHRRTIMEKLGEDTSHKTEPLAEDSDEKNEFGPRSGKGKAA